MSLTLHPLILAGGKSTRMKFPKHLLQLPDGTPLYQHQVDILHQACPESPTVHISLAKSSPVDAFLEDAAANHSTSPETGINIIYDIDPNETAQSAGPAQGLQSAFRADPTATWLVAAVDYPLLTVDALRQLQEAYTPPVTCFRNQEGFCEPLVGIWSPEALGRLEDNVREGRGSGPSAVVRELGGKQIDLPAGCEVWLTNVNTPTDWDEVLRLFGTSSRSANS